MSRLIIKHLPKKISADKLKSIFSAKGEVTDVQLKFNSEGTFRQFAFIGFRTEDQAEDAKNYFHNTYIDSNKIKIETCENIGSTSVKSWSKKSIPESNEKPVERQKEKKKKKKKHSLDETPDELKEDPKLAEFLSLHERKTTWKDSSQLQNEQRSTDINESDSGIDDENDEETQDLKVGEKVTKKNEVTLTTKANLPAKKVVLFDDSCTVKVRDLPRGCKKSQIKKYFAPSKIISLRFCRKVRGMAYVKFKNEKDFKQALNKHRGFLDGNRISVVKYAQSKTEKANVVSNYSNTDNEADPLTETGRIFIRNLCYSVTEEDIENHFKVFGPVTEVHLPVDAFTRKLKGFAFVTFVFPEHAVKAFSKLDGSSFQGRTLHILPAKNRKPVDEGEENEETSFKKQKENKLKSSSGSWHNWNTLFLGANAVADVMAQKYNTTKSKLLNAESKSSVAVTMALGETQIVSETGEFLTSQGVCLEAFQNPQTERSKTIILVKNLPANTKSHQLRDIFSIHGQINRLVLPPSGVTAIIEFQHPTEAKLAFCKLAYTKFQHMPLYLEWAPVNALSKTDSVSESSVKKAEDKVKHEKLKDKEESENSPGASSEPKEVEDEAENEVQEQGTVLFVKNLNFDTSEESLKSHFESCGKIISATIAKKQDTKNPGYQLSMGYGFVQFKKKKYASKALKELQQSCLDNHNLELKLSNRDTLVPHGQRKITKPGEQKSTKILVRNIPFEASKKEIKEIFSVFGELKALRLPRKVTGEHRGFGFVDYLTRHDAKRAMTSLAASTHVFGRRLVLEWAEADNEDDVDLLRKKTAKHYDHAPSKKSRLVTSPIDAQGGLDEAGWA